MTREEKTFLNIGSNILVQIVMGISGLVIPRLILTKFGSDVNGLVNSISQYVYYASLVELGIGNAALLLYYMPIVKQNYFEISEISSELKRRYNTSGIYYSFIILVMAVVYPLIVHTVFSYEFVVSLILIMAGTTIIDFFVVAKYKVILLAFQKYYIVNCFKIIATLLYTIICVVLLFGGFSIHVVKCAIVIVHLGEAIAISIYTREQYSDIKYGCKKRIELPQQNNTMIHQIVSIVIYNIDLIVLSTCLGDNNMKEVSVYSVYMLAASMINNLMSSLITSMDAMFGEMIARKENEKIKEFFKNYEIYYLIINYLLWGCYAVLVLPFINCYVGNISDVNYFRLSAAILFAVNGALANGKDPHGILIRAYGHYRESQKYVIIEAIINIVLSLILVQIMGLNGVLVGTLIGHIAGNVGLTVYGDINLLKRNTIESIKPHFINISVLILAVWVEVLVFQNVNSWIVWFGVALLITIFNLTLLICVNYLFNRKSIETGLNIFLRGK